MNKYRYNTLKNFKLSVCCFIPFNQRLIKGKIHLISLSNDILFLDFGFKHEVEIFRNELKIRIKLTSLTETCNYIKPISMVQFNIITLETFFFNKILIEKQKNIIHLKLFYFLLFLQNKNKPKKYYIKGRLLNRIKGGFAVGICGYIAFLPLSHSLFKKLGTFGGMSLFYVLTVDIEKQVFVISQSRIDSLFKKRLKKLKSRFFNIKMHINQIFMVDITQFGQSIRL